MSHLPLTEGRPPKGTAGRERLPPVPAAGQRTAQRCDQDCVVPLRLTCLWRRSRRLYSGEASSCPAVNGASREENTVAGPRGASLTPAVRPERPRRWGSRESAPRCPHRHLFPLDATSDHFYLHSAPLASGPPQCFPLCSEHSPHLSPSLKGTSPDGLH